MKKCPFLAILLVMSMSILSGCSSVRDSIAIAETRSQLTEVRAAALPQPMDATDWKPTSLEVVNQLDGVAMNVKIGTVLPEGMTVEFTNKSGKQCLYGEAFGLEQKLDGSWYQVPVAFEGNYAFHFIGYMLAPGDHRELVVKWGWPYGELGPGEYRLVKSVEDFRGTGDSDTYCLVAEFVIGLQLTGWPETRDITESDAIEIAYLSLDEASKRTCVDWEGARVEDYRASSDHFIAGLAGTVNIRARDVYRVTFRTKDEAFLGPITVYLDKGSSEVLGFDIRY